MSQLAIDANRGMYKFRNACDGGLRHRRVWSKYSVEASCNLCRLRQHLQRLERFNRFSQDFNRIADSVHKCKSSGGKQHPH